MAEEKKHEIDTDDAEKFIVKSRVEILRILRKLAHEMDIVSAVFHGGKDVLITAVLGIDPEVDVIYLDTNASSVYNDPLLSSKRTIFVCAKDGVKVQWISTEVEMVEYQGREAFRVAIPETLKHVQKRGLFRIDTPVIDPVMCKIQIEEENSVQVPLVDICAEGIGVILPEPPVEEIQKGAIFENCALILPEIGVVPVTLIVMGVWKATLKNWEVSHRAGLEFVDIRSGIQSRVQRYINLLQRNRMTR